MPNTVSIEEWVKSHGVFIDNVLVPYRMTYPFPDTIDDVKDIFGKILFENPRKMSSELFLAHVEDFYVGTSKIVNRNLLTEISNFNDCGYGHELKIDRAENIKSGVHLLSKWSGENYWHWILSSLSRLSLLKDIPSNAVYLVNSLSNKFVRDSLRVMGIGEHQCVGIENIGRYVYCKRLLLPSPVGDCDKMGLLFLRQRIKDKIKPVESINRIYISRSKTRVVENEHAVMDLLRKMGFKMVQCEKMSFEEQVRTFYDADVIVAPHGAGLTNLIFAKDNAKVIEIRSPNYFGSCYYYLSHHLGFRYCSLYGEGNLPKTRVEASSGLYANIRVSIPRLQQTLDYICVK